MENVTSTNNGLEKVLRVILRLGLLVILSIFFVLLSGFVLPLVAPDLSRSMLAGDNKIFWYASRGSAVIGYVMLWVSTLMGLMMTTRLGKTWPGMKASNELHEYVSNLGLLFTVFHGLILMGDQYLKPGLLNILLPFGFNSYRPVWVGLGQVVFYVWGILIISFYIRRFIGRKTWRLLHYAGFLAFLVGMLHGIASGTDTAQIWMQIIYWLSSASVLFLVIYRILMRNTVTDQANRINQ